MTKARRNKLAVAGGVTALLLAAGDVRLPLAAIKSLADYDLLADKAVIYTDASRLEVSPVQRWWLRKRMPELTEGESVPRITVRVRWFFLFLARVRSGHRVSPTGAEARDCLYIWCFGAWIPAYSFSHVMA